MKLVLAEAGAAAMSQLEAVNEEALDDLMQRLFELRVEVQSSLSDVNIELASVKRKVYGKVCCQLLAQCLGVTHSESGAARVALLKLASRSCNSLWRASVSCRCTVMCI